MVFKNNIREVNFKASGPHFLLAKLFTIFSNWNCFEKPLYWPVFSNRHSCTDAFMTDTLHFVKLPKQQAAGFHVLVSMLPLHSQFPTEPGSKGLFKTLFVGPTTFITNLQLPAGGWRTLVACWALLPAIASRWMSPARHGGRQSLAKRPPPQTCSGGWGRAARRRRGLPPASGPPRLQDSKVRRVKGHCSETPLLLLALNLIAHNC